MAAGNKQLSSSGEALRLRDDGLTWRAVERQVVALDLQSSTYLSLNSSGAVLWRQLSEGTDRPALARALVDAGCDPSSAEADVDVFLDALAELQLLA